MEAETWKLIVDSSQAAAAFAGALSAVFAGWAVWTTNSARADSVLLGQATLNLERAYESLFGDGYDDTNPRYEPEHWLVSARLLIDFEIAKKKIKNKLTKQECLSHEEHWRLLFAKRIDSLELNHTGYFSSRTVFIEKLAVRAIYLFATPNPMSNLERLKSYDLRASSYIQQTWRIGRTYAK